MVHVWFFSSSLCLTGCLPASLHPVLLRPVLVQSAALWSGLLDTHVDLHLWVKNPVIWQKNPARLSHPHPLTSFSSSSSLWMTDPSLNSKPFRKLFLKVSFPLWIFHRLAVHLQGTQQCPADLGRLVEGFTKLLRSVDSTDSTQLASSFMCSGQKLENWQFKLIQEAQTPSIYSKGSLWEPHSQRVGSRPHISNPTGNQSSQSARKQTGYYENMDSNTLWYKKVRGEVENSSCCRKCMLINGATKD